VFDLLLILVSFSKLHSYFNIHYKFNISCYYSSTLSHYFLTFSLCVLTTISNDYYSKNLKNRPVTSHSYCMQLLHGFRCFDFVSDIPLLLQLLWMTKLTKIVYNTDIKVLVKSSRQDHLKATWVWAKVFKKPICKLHFSLVATFLSICRLPKKPKFPSWAESLC
jgi:hypothetical protein